MAELELLYPEHELKHKMAHNDSHKFESSFVSLTIPENHSVMLRDLAGASLGVWVAHGEGKFDLPYDSDRYHVIARYAYDAYPANPTARPTLSQGSAALMAVIWLLCLTPSVRSSPGNALTTPRLTAVSTR